MQKTAISGNRTPVTRIRRNIFCQLSCTSATIRLLSYFARNKTGQGFIDFCNTLVPDLLSITEQPHAHTHTHALSCTDLFLTHEMVNISRAWQTPLYILGFVSMLFVQCISVKSYFASANISLSLSLPLSLSRSHTVSQCLHPIFCQFFASAGHLKRVSF